jgi:NAD(P)H-nitrite reductase large subunit
VCAQPHYLLFLFVLIRIFWSSLADEQSVTKVDKSAKTVTNSSGETIKYDNLVLAPGGKPRKIPVDGADLEGVFTLRTVEDTKKIVSSVTKDSEIVIIGTSFIGMEVSMALIKKEPKSVTLVGMDEVPFAAILGEDIGKAIMEVSLVFALMVMKLTSRA